MKKKVFMCIIFLVSAALFAQEKDSIYSKMHDSIVTNNLEKLSSLIESTENINTVEYDGHHVFESIFVMDNCEAAEMLLIAGLDLDYENKDGISLEKMILESNNKTLESFIERYKK